MPRQARGARRPTREELTDVQRQILAALPNDDFRELFIDQLPPIQPGNPLAKKKAQLIQRHVGLLDAAIRTLRTHKEQLERLAGSLENGTGPSQVDLRAELAPPKIDGVALQYVRGKRAG
jgi:hypothetical protein